MGKLKDQMLMEMELRNLSDRTIKAYLGHMVSYTKKFGKSPAEMGETEIRQYLHYLKKEKCSSWSGINIGYSALKFFYTKTLHRGWNVEHIPRPKGETRLPVVLSRTEIKKLFDAADELKHLAILMTTYAGGLRVSETAHLKIADIDSSRMLIRINQGKGKKDRYTLLSEVALKELRCYYRKYRPTTWLFPGRNNDSPIDTGTIQQIMKETKDRAGILKAATPHTLRHSFATHFLEDGGDLFHLKELLGHSSLKTTLIYIHIQRKSLKKLISPLDRMSEAEQR
jgi:site-specific recombinase XerD